MSMNIHDFFYLCATFVYASLALLLVTIMLFRAVFTVRCKIGSFNFLSSNLCTFLGVILFILTLKFPTSSFDWIVYLLRGMF